MPIGSQVIYNAGDLILSTVSSSGNTFVETKIAAATSSVILFNSSGTLTSASLNSTTVGTASYVSGSTSIITSITASNISASGAIIASSFTGSFSGSIINAVNAISASYALTSSYSTYTETSSLASFSQNAQDILLYVKNDSGQILQKGTVVRIVGVDNSSNVAKIQLADFSNENNSANTLGFTNETFAINGFGYVMTEGLLTSVNTDGFTAGDLLYLSSSGTYTNVKPTPPNHGVRLGQAIRIQLNNGTIYVRIDNGAELDELHNVLDTSTTSSYGDLLVKSGSIWINNKNLTGSYVITGSLNVTQNVSCSVITSSFAYLSNIGFTNQTVASDTSVFPTGSVTGGFILDGGIYKNGLYRTRFVKIDRSGNLPLYIQETQGSSGSFSNLARFGTHANSTNTFEVFGNTNIQGLLISSNISSSNITASNISASRTGSFSIVGVGTTSPAAKLAVGSNPTYAAGVTLIVGTPGNPSTSGTAQPYANLRLGTNTGNSQVLDFGIYDASPYGSWIQAAGGGNLAFPSPLVLNPTGGSLGIGTSNPVATLDIENAVANIPVLNLGGGISGENVSDLYVLNSYNANTGVGYSAKVIGVNISGSLTDQNIPVQRTVWSGVTSATAIVLGADGPRQGTQDNAFQIWTTSEGTSGSLLTQKFSLTSTGEVGIGTTSPGSKLTVSGSIESLTDSGGEGGQLVLRGNTYRYNIDNFNGQALRFFREDDTTTANGQVLMYLSSSGNVGIGNTDPSFLIDVSGNSRHGAISTNVHQFTGSVSLSGGLSLTNLTASNISASGNIIASRITSSNVLINGNLTVTGSIFASLFSASYIYITSSQLVVTDNIITLNALSPYQRYAGMEMYDSGSGNLSSFLWDGQGDYFFVTGSGVNSKIIVGPDQQTNLTSGRLTKATGTNIIGDSIVSEDGIGITVSGYISGSSVMTANITCSNISASKTGSFGIVGIGTSSPASKLDVRNGYITAGTDTSTAGSLILAGYYTAGSLTTLGTEQASGGPVLAYAVYPSASVGTFRSSTSITISRSAYTQNGGNHRWYLGPTQTVAIGDQASLDEIMRLTTTGLGIGTTIPGSKLQINDSTPTLTLRADDGGVSRKAYIDFYTTFFNYPADVGARRTSTISTGFADGTYGTWGTEFMAFHVGSGSANDSALLPIERMRIDGSGNVGIGVKSPSGRLHITASATSGESLIYLSKGSGSISQNFITAVNEINQASYRVTSDINGYTQQTLYRNGTSYVYHDAYWSSWINNANYSQGGLNLGSSGLTHGYGLTIARPATSGSLYVSGSSVFTGSVGISGSINLSGPIIYDNSVLMDFGRTTTPAISTNYVVLQNITGSYNAAFFDYFVSSGSNFRAGTVIAGWSGSSINYTEYSTTDTGNTNQLTMSVDLSSSFVRLLTTVSTTTNWSVKTSGRYL